MNKEIENAKIRLKSNNIDESLAKYYYNYLVNNNKDISLFNEGIEKIIKGIPIQYVIGNVNFYGNILNVNKNVLIPRFETELLVEKTIKYIKDNFTNKINILDIGTGSGCIAITLKKELNCDIEAIDISKSALEVAKENAILNKVDINFILSDLFTNINSKYDVIISNPPYISYNEKIMDIVKNNEPKTALYADNEGLYFYEEILKNASKYLNDNYLIAFEIGYTQADKIKEIANKYLNNINISIQKDYSNKDRYIFINNK